MGDRNTKIIKNMVSFAEKILMENKIQNVLQFYELTNNLKDIVRTGWKQWKVSAERVESVAEHIFSTCMLAIAINSEFDYGIDLHKVIFMLAVHELEEIVIGDITPFQDVTEQDMKTKGQEAVAEVLSSLTNKQEIIDLINEFEKSETKDARFAKMVDKLDAGLQCKIYDKRGHVNVSDENIDVQRRCNLAKRNYGTLSDSWLEYCIESYNFDEIFTEIARGARKNKNWSSGDR
jgi:putative hydrolase of HD superfamily